MLAVMLHRLCRQFAGPTGALGSLAGFVMARKNGPLNAWVVERLDARPGDRVVEVGFGTGLAVALHAARGAHVAGVDRSDVMLRQATRRNRGPIRAGRVDLRVGAAEKLPFADASFTHALAVNSLQFWKPAADGLRELHRVLRPDGRLVLAQRRFRAAAGRLDRSRFGLGDEALVALVETFSSVGFRDVDVAEREIAGETIATLR